MSSRNFCKLAFLIRFCLQQLKLKKKQNCKCIRVKSKLKINEENDKVDLCSTFSEFHIEKCNRGSL